MEFRQQIARFLSRYQTVGWILLLMGGALIAQLVLMLLLPNAAYSTLMSFLVLPARLDTLLVQPWSILTWPLFSLKLDFFNLLFSGFILWSFGQIHQQLLGDVRTRRLVMLMVPIIGLLTVSISHFLPSSPFEAGTQAKTEVAVISPNDTDASPEGATDEVVADSASANEMKGPGAAADRKRTERSELLQSSAKSSLNLWFPSGMIPLIMVLVLSCATLVPTFPIQLFLLGRVNIVWIAAALLVLELLYSLFITPLAIAILLGSALGFFHILLLRNGTDITEAIWSYYSDAGQPRMKVKYGESPKPRANGQSAARNSSRSSDRVSDISQEIIDGILDKISAKGYESLSREEKELLFKASSREDE